MKTEVTLVRPFMGGEVRQRSKSQLMSATDLVKIGNIKRRELGLSTFNLSQYLKLQSTRDFIEELQKDNERVLISSRGRNAATWVHPLLLVDIALSINPRFKVEVYHWIMDELLKARNLSGVSYRKMVGAIYERAPKKDFHQIITKVANYIKDQCNVKDWNQATEKQLMLRDKMHENIALLCSVLTNYKEAVRVGIMNAKKDFNELD